MMRIPLAVLAAITISVAYSPLAVEGRENGQESEEIQLNIFSLFKKKSEPAPKEQVPAAQEEQDAADVMRGRIHHAHYIRERVEAFAQEREEPPEGFTEDDLYELLNQNLSEFMDISKEVRDLKEEMDDTERVYWTAHAWFMYGYILARADMAEEAESHLHGAFETLQLIEQSVPYPNERLAIITSHVSNGRYFSSLAAFASYCASLSQQGKEEEADAAYRMGVSIAKEKFADDKVMVSEALRKAGEHFMTSSGEESLAYFTEAVNLIESEMDLGESVAEGDLSLLYLKDKIAFQLMFLGREAELAEAKAELAPYEDSMTWKQEYNIYERDEE